MAQRLRCIFSHFCVNSRKALTHSDTHTHIPTYARSPACTCMYVCVLHSSCDLIPIPFVAVAVCFHFRPSLSLAKESERGRGKGRVGQAGLAASRSHTKLLHTTMFTMCDKRCRKKKIHKLLANLLLLLSLPPSSSTSITPTTLSLSFAVCRSSWLPYSPIMSFIKALLVLLSSLLSLSTSLPKLTYPFCTFAFSTGYCCCCACRKVTYIFFFNIYAHFFLFTY